MPIEFHKLLLKRVEEFIDARDMHPLDALLLFETNKLQEVFEEGGLYKTRDFYFTKEGGLYDTENPVDVFAFKIVADTDTHKCSYESIKPLTL